MKKYFAIARAEWLDALQYRGEIMLWVIIESIPVFIMAFLWIASQSQLVNLGISVRTLVTYYVVVLVISRLTAFYFDNGLQKQIRDGRFSAYLVKPLRLPLAYIPQNLGGKSFTVFFLLLPLVIIIAVIFKNQLLIPSGWRLLLFFISLIPAYFIQFSLTVLVSSVAFFWEQSYAVMHLRWVLENVVGGYLIPLYLYPNWLVLATGFLPFKYVYFVPASIYSGTMPADSAYFQIALSMIWAVVLFFFSRLVWKKGVNSYSSVGG